MTSMTFCDACGYKHSRPVLVASKPGAPGAFVDFEGCWWTYAPNKNREETQ